MWACHDTCVETGQLVRLCRLLPSCGSSGLPISQACCDQPSPSCLGKVTFLSSNDHAGYSFFPLTCVYFLVLVSHSSCSAVSSARWTSVPVLIPLQILYSELNAVFSHLLTATFSDRKQVFLCSLPVLQAEI